jgi:hypothetical protein
MEEDETKLTVGLYVRMLPETKAALKRIAKASGHGMRGSALLLRLAAYGIIRYAESHDGKVPRGDIDIRQHVDASVNGDDEISGKKGRAAASASEKLTKLRGDRNKTAR